MKKKITTGLKAAVMLIIAEDNHALKNIIGTIVKSASRTMGVKKNSIFSGNNKKA